MLAIQEWGQLSMAEFSRLCQIVDDRFHKPGVRFDITQITRDSTGVVVTLNIEKGRLAVVLTPSKSYVSRAASGGQEAA